jgi:integrase
MAMWNKVWITKRKTKKGIRYDLRWYDRRGFQHSESAGTNRRTAESLRKKKEWELNQGIVTGTERISYDRFVKEHIELRQGTVAPSTIKIEIRVLDLVREICRPRMISDLKPVSIEKFKAERLKTLSVSYVNLHLRTLRSILNKAVRRGYLKSNPAKGIDYAQDVEKPKRILEVEDIEALLDACPNVKWRVFCYLAVACGLRLGEITNLLWKDVDLEKGLVHVQNRQDWRTKGKRNRTVGLNERGNQMLEKLRLQTGFRRYVLVTKEGRQWRNNIHRDFDRIVDKSGITRCTPQDLRKTFCSQLAMAGLNEAIVQRLAGHANITTTLKYYTEIFQKDLKEATRKLAY